MRLTYPTALLPSLSTAVSLSDFSPRNTNLTPGCASVYTQQITACTPTDFHDLSVSICSTRCLAGVLAIESLVQTACADDDVEADTIIGLFLAGLGIRTVCPQTKRLVGTPPAATISHSVPGYPGPTIGSSTLRLSEVTSSATGLLVETSPSPVRTRSSTASSSPSSSEESITTSAAPTSTAAPTTTAALVDTGIASGVRPTAASSSSAEARQTGGGGGGSLLDVGQNGAAGRSRGMGMWVWGVSFAALGWVLGGGMV
ncbi:hypothetical protein W97_03353 [Coniosporium apollinis CBS 100218]|uniref:Uncharacterized protein n=1 Tax=Coniosporium apollinis (strain CBS 100218) TaxID=1168221 RepID=R7YQK8_CONA1|nr:uncharacterized protein W97_03353 [Coniosporium apollinis CBS 100218]EON64123.1 hypothetical protein W97_03353 [Coniosporium apollinis CBS 100218]